jgi:hypothetical protein
MLSFCFLLKRQDLACKSANINSLNLHRCTGFSIQDINDASRIISDSLEIIVVNHYDTQIGILHYEVGEPSRFLADVAGADDGYYIALQEMCDADFLGNILDAHPQSILALHLPPREDESVRLKDHIHFGSASVIPSLSSSHVGQVNEPHEPNGKCLKCKSPGIAAFGFQVG